MGEHKAARYSLPGINHAALLTYPTGCTRIGTVKGRVPLVARKILVLRGLSISVIVRCSAQRCSQWLTIPQKIKPPTRGHGVRGNGRVAPKLELGCSATPVISPIVTIEAPVATQVFKVEWQRRGIARVILVLYGRSTGKVSIVCRRSGVQNIG